MKLFEPITIRGVKFKNRIIMPAMGTNVGFSNPRGKAYWLERARGGVGTIISYGIRLDMLLFDEAWGKPGGAAKFAEGLGRLARQVQEFGARFGIQLWHTNRLPMGMGNPPGSECVGPSAGHRKPNIFEPATEMRELTIPEIEFIIGKFGKAAARAKEVGVHFVEFHGAAMYLPCQFFSPLHNRRTDKYGRDLAGRMRFGIECVIAMREAVGENYPVFFRLGAMDESPGGITLEDSAKYSLELERAGVDVLNVTTAMSSEATGMGPDKPMGMYLHLAETIKRNVHIPVATVGRINTAEVAESILSQRKADFVAVGRQLIADPFWPDKVARGEFADIRPCLSCCVCLDKGVMANLPVCCTVNPWAGKEDEQHGVGSTERPRKVLVVGGGPGGMEAAAVAAMRGHSVTLVEKENRLGGQLLLAGVPPYKDVISRFRDYLIRQVEKAGVSLKLGEEVTRKFIESSRPEVIILATGGNPIIPELPGVDGANVVTALDVLSGRARVGERVVIIGGGMVGCETAEYLVPRCKKVTILEQLEIIGRDIGKYAKLDVVERWEKAGIKMETLAKVIEINPNGVTADRDGRQEFFEADTVVVAVGMRANSQLARELEGWSGEVHLVGECVQPRKIVDAISEGAWTACKI